MEEITIKRKRYEIGKLFCQTDESTIHFVYTKGREYLLVRYFKNYDFAMNDYKRLAKAGINVPRIIANDKKEHLVVKEYIGGPTVLDELIINDLSDHYFEELFLAYRFCRFSKINLNYLPENFSMKNGKLFYVSNDVADYSPQRNLENWGIRYWIYTAEFSQYLKEKKMNVNPKRILKEEVANKKIVLLSVTYW
ncbi:MAG: hypothetical protein WC366_04295 [Bacilli bacterium]|jgi:hypothetical protein